MSDLAARFGSTELDDIRDREPVSGVFERFGTRLRRTGRTFVCSCPFHAEKTPSCVIDDRKAVWHCKGCSAGGDVFAAMMQLAGCTFPEAVERLGGTRELTEQDRNAIEKRAREREAQIAAEAQRNAEKVTRLWGEAQPLIGSRAEAYLEARGVAAPTRADLGYHPALPYWGFADAEAQAPTELGAFPAMLGAIRARDGALIGVHRTYLDAGEPAKLRPPGCGERNRAKKITGNQLGGSIALSPPSPRMAYGEGIETTLSWRVLMGATARSFGLAALVSLGNICGGARAHRPHPTKKHADGRPVLIPDGFPDFSRPGFVPGLDVEAAVLIGDSDSDGPGTKTRLLTGGRRWADDPDRRSAIRVGVSMADAGLDFNDQLLREADQ